MYIDLLMNFVWRLVGAFDDLLLHIDLNAAARMRGRVPLND
jgi:hypothetical protein